ncbi:MAG: TetR/AcrR family transcriptional regulator [Peptococcaceae bacterium]|nr:TetR/AcrR family transcriptional regulator [Peptococcaceae bacterium]
MKTKANEVSQSQRILKAAIKCIAKKGYANASLRDIADEAGVVLSQLNYYYNNKQGLFVEVVKRLSQQYLSEIENILQQGETKREKTAALTEYFQKILKDNPELFKLLFDLSSMALWSDPLRELIDNFFQEVAMLIEKYILQSKWQEDKRLKKYSRAVSRIMLGAMIGTSIQVVLAVDKEELMDSLNAIQVIFAK